MRKEASKVEIRKCIGWLVSGDNRALLQSNMNSAWQKSVETRASWPLLVGVHASWLGQIKRIASSKISKSIDLLPH